MRSVGPGGSDIEVESRHQTVRRKERDWDSSDGSLSQALYLLMGGDADPPRLCCRVLKLRAGLWSV
jgi:hypothetical protein